MHFVVVCQGFGSKGGSLSGSQDVRLNDITLLHHCTLMRFGSTFNAVIDETKSLPRKEKWHKPIKYAIHFG
jgi:hypothetical protein